MPGHGQGFQVLPVPARPWSQSVNGRPVQPGPGLEQNWKEWCFQGITRPGQGLFQSVFPDARPGPGLFQVCFPCLFSMMPGLVQGYSKVGLMASKLGFTSTQGL